MAEPLPVTARELVAMMEEAGGDVLEAAGQLLKARVIPNIPPTDPQHDPDPNYSLRDHVEVRRYGNTVSVAVEGPYAVKIHENMQMQHPRGGGPKYLEREATAFVRELEGMLAGEVARTFATGRRRGGGLSRGFATDIETGTSRGL
jgi:hypothetical protein